MNGLEVVKEVKFTEVKVMLNEIKTLSVLIVVGRTYVQVRVRRLLIC
ncbi:hypothetical protein ACIQV0_05015 [Lysinibacillus capsici]